MATDPNINPNQNFFDPGQGGNPVGGAVATPNPTAIGNFQGENPPINTSQPTPLDTNTQAPIASSSSATPTAPYVVKQGDTLSQIAQSNGMSLQDLIKANPNIKDPNKINTGQQINLANSSQTIANKYQTALDNMKGTPPQTASDANAQIQSMLPSDTTKDTSGVDAAAAITQKLQNDPAIAQLMADHQASLTAQAQQQTLEEQYTKMSNDLGLPALNTQLINMKAVMDGTIDNIRQEIQSAGGVADESQIQALASARNKTLSQNYNNLLQTRDSAVSQINTMIGLAEKDKQIATQQMNDNLNFDKQIADYEQKFQQNAQDGYNNIIKSVGYTGLFHSLNPSDVPLVEKSLGLPQGSLQSLAQQEVQNNQASQQKDALQNQLLQAQISNTQATTAKTRAETGVANGGVTTQIQTQSGPKTVPTVLSPYIQTSYDGTTYADLSSLSPTDKAKMAQVASQSGIKPILEAGTAGKLNAISVSKTNLNNIQNSLAGLLNDKQTPFIQGLENSAKSFLGNADVKSFNAWRTAVINNVQALAGGAGSGLRINQAEIDTALKNDLPVLTGTGADNLSTAIAKIGKLNSQMDVWTKQLLGGGNTASGNQPGFIPPTGSVIQSGGKSYHVIDAKGNLQPI